MDECLVFSSVQLSVFWGNIGRLVDIKRNKQFVRESKTRESLYILTLKYVEEPIKTSAAIMPLWLISHMLVFNNIFGQIRCAQLLTWTGHVCLIHVNCPCCGRNNFLCQYHSILLVANTCEQYLTFFGTDFSAAFLCISLMVYTFWNLLVHCSLKWIWHLALDVVCHFAVAMQCVAVKAPPY